MRSPTLLTTAGGKGAAPNLGLSCVLFGFLLDFSMPDENPCYRSKRGNVSVKRYGGVGVAVVVVWRAKKFLKVL